MLNIKTRNIKARVKLVYCKFCLQVFNLSILCITGLLVEGALLNIKLFYGDGWVFVPVYSKSQASSSQPKLNLLI